MKVKTFISQSSHNDFFQLMENFLSHAQTGGKDEKDLMINELAQQKERLENTYVQYRGKFDELHRLIAEYQEQQTEIRKKIRLIQLDKKEKKTAGAGYFKKGLRLGNSFQHMIYIYLHIFFIDDLWGSLTDLWEFVF